MTEQKTARFGWFYAVGSFLAVLMSLAIAYYLSHCTEETEENATLHSWALLGDAIGGVLTVSLVVFAAKELFDATHTLNLQVNAFNALATQIKASTDNRLRIDTPTLVFRLELPHPNQRYWEQLTIAAEKNMYTEPRILEFFLHHKEPVVQVEFTFFQCMGIRTTQKGIMNAESPTENRNMAILNPGHRSGQLCLVCFCAADSPAFVLIECSTNLRRYKFEIPLGDKPSVDTDWLALLGMPISERA